MITKRYTVVRTSFGDLYITAEHDRLLRIGTDRPHVCAAMRNDTHPLLQHCAHTLMAYLNGETTTFRNDIPIRPLPFQRDVFEAVKKIPYGQTATSEEVARAIGKPHAVRAVETVCRNNPLYIAVPCHRVILHTTDNHSASRSLFPDEVLRKLEQRYLDKADKRR